MAILTARLHRLFLFALVTLVVIGGYMGVGCGLDFSPDLGAGGEFACGASGSCPSGFACASDNKCYPAGALPARADSGAANARDAAAKDDGEAGGPAVPSLAIGDITVTEGNDGTTPAVFQVKLSAPAASDILVDYATADGTATAGSDYTATSGTLTFPAGSDTQTISVDVLGDTIAEGKEETFLVRLDNARGASIATAAATGTITDDEGVPTLSIDKPSVPEGNAGTTTLQFTVTLSAATDHDVVVAFATSAGTATTGTDFEAASGTLTFPPGTTSQTISVTIDGDTISEPDETVFVTLSKATGATIGTSKGTGTIANDDALPTLSIADVTMAEGSSGTKAFAFAVTLSAPSSGTVTVAYATADDTAAMGTDYVATSGTLTFSAGQTTKTVNVSVTGDAADEANETFFVNLSGATGATIADDKGVGTITNDDSPFPTITIDDVTVAEADTGTQLATFTVTLSAPSTNTVTVAYATGGGTAVPPGDYTATSGTLSFNAGETSKTFTVPVKGDAIFEVDETFFVNLTNPVAAVIGDGQGQATIPNDDAMPTFSVNSKAVAEGDVGPTALVFTVTLSTTPGVTTTVDYATADATAVAGVDYTTTTGTLTFLAGGAKTQTISVPILGDTLDEVGETFNLNLSNATNATIVTGTGIGTINDDDATPTLAIDDVTQNEGTGGTTTSFTFTVTLSAVSGQTVTVTVKTANGTATVANSDYTALPSTVLTFNPGVTSQTVTVAVTQDSTNEPDETFLVNLSGAVNATIPAGTKGTGTITNDD